jgi:hypothetical protein
MGVGEFGGGLLTSSPAFSASSCEKVSRFYRKQVRTQAIESLLTDDKRCKCVSSALRIPLESFLIAGWQMSHYVIEDFCTFRLRNAVRLE